MAKKETAAKTAAKEMAKEAKQTTQKETKTEKSPVSVIQLGDLDKLAQQKALSQLDPNHQVDLMTGLRKMLHEDPNAAVKYDISQDAVDKMNKLVMLGHVAIFTNTVLVENTPFAVMMRKSQLEAIKEVAPMLGITIDATKALPAPTEGEDVVKLPSTAIEVSKDAAKKAIDEAKAATKSVKTNPVDIKTEEELHDALLNIITSGNGDTKLYPKIHTAIQFYRSYLDVQAEKSDDPKKAHADVKSRSNDNLLAEIADIIGDFPFTMGGMAKFMYDSVQDSHSPVVAFCTYREASLNEKTGMPQIEDQLVADTVKVLVDWMGRTEKAKIQKSIEACEKNIEVLKKDEKKNAKAIESNKAKMKQEKEKLEKVDHTIRYITAPDSDVVDKFKETYQDNKHEMFKKCRMMFSKVMQTYYPGMKPNMVENKEILLNNIHQYVGIVSNFFRTPTSQLQGYSESNIVPLELKKAEEKDDESKKAQESAK